jgi:hypothetical protein
VRCLIGMLLSACEFLRFLSVIMLMWTCQAQSTGRPAEAEMGSRRAPDMHGTVVATSQLLISHDPR